MKTKLYFILATLLIGITSFAQVNDMANFGDSNTSNKTSLKKLTNSIYQISGDIGNMGVYFGKNETILIDTQTRDEIENDIKIIKRISKNPIKYIVNTGFHPEHVGGNNFVKKKENVIILSSEKTRLNNNSKTDNKAFSGSVKADITFSKKMTIYIDGEKIELIPINNGSSNGDIIVYFTKSNVLFTGDVFYNSKRYPKLDFSNGGSIDGLISGLNSILGICNNSTKIVPGHGGVSNKSEVNSYANMLSIIFKKITYKREVGNTLEAVINSKSSITDKYDAKGYNKGEVKSEDLITEIYNQLAEKMGPLDTRTPEEKAMERLKEMQAEKKNKGKN